LDDDEGTGACKEARYLHLSAFDLLSVEERREMYLPSHWLMLAFFS
jgi:hypothetical protein